MQLSKHTIFGKIPDSDNFFIINPLSGQADILEKSWGERVAQGDYPDSQAFMEKGYLADSASEELEFEKKYNEFIIKRDSDEIQVFFVPWYACNFSCSYCYQDQYTNQSGRLEPQVIDAFYDYIDKEFSKRNKYITVFGGEPLLSTAEAHTSIEHILEGAWERKLDCAIVTNGYNLKEYVPLLQRGPIREIQVTLDGTEFIHNERRPLKNGGSTFAQIVEGIDAALEAQLKINLRVVIDKKNITNLLELSRFAIEKKWTDNPLFKTQLGRNYELHHCSSHPQDLFGRLELYEHLHGLIKKNPELTRFHKPAFSISRFLFENGTLPDPLFDACPGCKSEWAFDYTGSIYSCTATVGKSDQKLGTFYPDVFLDKKRVDTWYNRTIKTVEKCKSCSASLICGGGCASVAENTTGSLYGPDCRPVKELVGLGLSTYFGNEVVDE